MAAANDSQGLKIAVAVFVMLTVVLAVTTYFSYSAYNQADAKLTASEAKLRTQTEASNIALTRVEELAKEIGLRSTEPDSVKAEMTKEKTKVSEEINVMVQEVQGAIGKVQTAGEARPELEEAKSKVAQIAAAFKNEPNQTYISSLSRAVDLMKNMALLNSQMAISYVDVKRGLEGANGVNAQKIAVAEKAVEDTKTDLSGEHDKHAAERASLIAKVDQYQTDNAKQATEIATLNARLRQTEDDLSKKLAVALQNLRAVRERVEKQENVLDRPDGVVTFVDYTRGEVHTNLTKNKGARPQMSLAIFDSQSPGLPTDKPKGSVELISVSEREGIARIVKTNRTIDPIKAGDLVYSAAWSPNEPMRFALIGKMDVNRDGKDDRADLKRMIEGSGGIVDYDLPPPDVGKESGKLTGRDAWYVIDERMPLSSQDTDNSGVTAGEYAEFLRKQSEAVREARLNGVRPLLIERLLPTLGYDYQAGVVGRTETIDRQSIKRLVAPRPNANLPKAATPPAARPPADADAAPK